jgi:hypothetical protein
MKYKARARRRRVAVTAAGIGALTVLGGTAYASETHSQQSEDPAGATLTNGGDAKSIIEQDSTVETGQLALANTGGNRALAISANVNLGSQDCTTSLSGGDIAGGEDNTTGNTGGNCNNDASQGNRATTRAGIETGDASAPNEAHTTVRQSNSGGSAVDNTASNNHVTADDGSASLHNGGDAFLKVEQTSSVGTYQDAFANTGDNTALGLGFGINAGSQSATTNNSGGNISGSEPEGNTAGNTGGNAGNKASQSNSGGTTATIKTGKATASNSSTTTVNQTNSGGASSTNTANGNSVKSDN